MTNEPKWPDTEERIDAIGRNGGEALHYNLPKRTQYGSKRARKLNKVNDNGSSNQRTSKSNMQE